MGLQSPPQEPAHDDPAEKDTESAELPPDKFESIMNGFHMLSCNKVDALEKRFEDLKQFAGDVALFFGEHENLEWEELFETFLTFFELIANAKQRNAVLAKKKEKERKKEENERKKKERMEKRKMKEMEEKKKMEEMERVKPPKEDPNEEEKDESFLENGPLERGHPIKIEDVINVRRAFMEHDQEDDNDDGQWFDEM